jgi:lysozyme family protein
MSDMQNKSKQRTFDLAFAWLLTIEGGHVNHPDDRGGETKFGISKKSYPELDIKSLTEDEAQAIYLADYWNESGCQHLPPALGFALFEAAVLHGPKQGVVFLQQSLKEQTSKRLMADGINGPITQAVARDANPYAVLEDFLTRRSRHMFDIAHGNSSQVIFLRGWMKRLFSLHRAVLSAFPSTQIPKQRAQAPKKRAQEEHNNAISKNRC